MAREQAGELPMTPSSIELSSVDRCSVDRNASFMSAHSSPSFSQEPDVEGLRRSMGRGVCADLSRSLLCMAGPSLWIHFSTVRSFGAKDVPLRSCAYADGPRSGAYWHELVVLRDGFVVCGSGGEAGWFPICSAPLQGAAA
ncbi:unnamed protein product [Durusdinium trenchii]|uniref:Uncharacterized protein n=1 Tax=Durusdinium trenchii TaxID=1381693 RepID=A0ABP0HAM2_9DINO